MKDRLGANPVPIQLPIGAEGDFLGVVDLVTMKALVWKDELGTEFEIVEIPERLADKARDRARTSGRGRRRLRRRSCEVILGEGRSPRTLKEAIRKATLSTKITPVLCGSSFKNKGVQPLLDAVIDYLPSPLEVPAVTGVEPASGDGEEPRGRPPRRRQRAVRGARLQDHVRPLRRQTHLLPRLLRQIAGRRSRAQRQNRAHRADRSPADDARELPRGDRGGLLGRHRAPASASRRSTGDTLAAPDAPIALESIEFPETVIAVAIEPKTKADQEKMGRALRVWARRTRPSGSNPTRKPARP